MKTTKALIVAIACWAAAAQHSVHASVVTVTGGDPGEGFSPAYRNVYAYGFSSSVAHTIQGVTFMPLALTNGTVTYSDANITLTADNPLTAYLGYAAPSLGGSADDNEMESLIQPVIYESSITLTLKGLTPGQTYQIDFFTWRPNSTQPDSTFSYNGVAGDSTGLIPANTILNIEKEAVASPTGEIVLRREVFNDLGLLESAFAVTIPEPSTMALLAAGGLLLWRKRSKW